MRLQHRIRNLSGACRRIESLLKIKWQRLGEHFAEVCQVTHDALLSIAEWMALAMARTLTRRCLATAMAAPLLRLLVDFVVFDIRLNDQPIPLVAAPHHDALRSAAIGQRRAVVAGVLGYIGFDGLDTACKEQLPSCEPAKIR